MNADLEARYTRWLRRRHPVAAWLSDWRRWRTRKRARPLGGI